MQKKDMNIEEIALAHSLTKDEFENIKKILGREPNYVEIGIFSAMWSEHCSYKSSKKYLIAALFIILSVVILAILYRVPNEGFKIVIQQLFAFEIVILFFVLIALAIFLLAKSIIDYANSKKTIQK